MDIETTSFITGIAVQTIILAYYFGKTANIITSLQETVKDIKIVTDESKYWHGKYEDLMRRVDRLEKS